MFKAAVGDAGSLGFGVWCAAPNVMGRAHSHCDIELNLPLSGEVEYFFGGKFQVLRPGEPALFWAGMPHVLTRASSEAEMIWAVIPLAWATQWQLPAAFVDALLRGQMRVAGESNGLNRALLERWCRELNPQSEQSGAAARKIVMLELEALLHRMAQGAPPKTGDATAAGGAQIEKLTAWVTRHYLEEITIDDIAGAAHLHPNYAMSLFKEKCGLSLWEYVTRLRVSHAQYLLLTTSRTASAIAREAGFASDSRFYAAFAQYAGCAPNVWRRQTLGAN